MFNADVLTFREFAMREPLPLVNIQSAVMEFCVGGMMSRYLALKMCW